MTPEQRTELQRLAEELNEWAEHIEYTPVQSGVNEYSGEPTGPEPQGPTRESDMYRRAASALLSLAAECEELRADNERLKEEMQDARYEYKEAMERMDDQG